MRVREIAEAVQITERYAYRVLNDLQEAGFVGEQLFSCRREDQPLAFHSLLWTTTHGLRREFGVSASKSRLSGKAPSRHRANRAGMELGDPSTFEVLDAAGVQLDEGRCQHEEYPRTL